MGEDLSGNTPSAAQLTQWADTFGLTHPVVADAGWGVTMQYAGFSWSMPSMHQLAPGGVVVRKKTVVSEAQIEAELP